MIKLTKHTNNDRTLELSIFTTLKVGVVAIMIIDAKKGR
jgi:hypothetical protein